MEIPSIISHVSVGTNDFPRAAAFYDAVLETVGARRIMTHGKAIAYGKQFPEFWVQEPFDVQPATRGNGTHFAFVAANPGQVDAFYEAAIAAGATCDGKPGPRPQYSDRYYACFVRDLDGNKIEATYYDMSSP